MGSDETNRLYRLIFVLVLTLAVCAAFLFLIQTFLIDIFLAAIFAGPPSTLRIMETVDVPRANDVRARQQTAISAQPSSKTVTAKTCHAGAHAVPECAA